MTAATYKSSILHLIEDIEDEQVLGDAYLAIQEILHPEDFIQESPADLEDTIIKRYESTLNGNVLTDTAMQTWINELTNGK